MEKPCGNLKGNKPTKHLSKLHKPLTNPSMLWLYKII